MGAKATTRPLGESIPPLKDHGVTDLVAASKGGVAMQSAQITQVGASPFTVLFASHGLMDMANSAYTVMVGGETAARAYVDQSTISPTKFDVIGGADTEVLHITVVGRMTGMSADPSDL